MSEHSKFPVEILTPEGEVFNDEVEMLVTRTSIGEVGVLANHAPLLTLLNHCELRLHTGDGEIKRFAQGQGYLQVANNHAMVLVDEIISPEELDPEELQQKLDEAEAKLNDLEEGSSEVKLAQQTKDRAEAFLRLADGQKN